MAAAPHLRAGHPHLCQLARDLVLQHAAVRQRPGTSVNIIYEDWRFQIFIYFCVLFHALNGLRIILLDIWPQFLKYQREAIWLQWLIFIPIYVLTVLIMIQTAMSAG
jgi:succinate dehydrogenase / fumarate reductase cytochrome b subunit